MSDSDQLQQDLIRHGAYVRRLAEVLAGPRGALDADDLSQDVWAAWIRQPRHGVENPRGWLRAAAKKLASLRRREDLHRRDREARAATLRADGRPTEEGATEEAMSAWLERGERLQAELGKLPPKLRDTLALRYMVELEPREIAERLDLSVDTVKSRLKRALAELRRRLEGQPEPRRFPSNHSFGVLLLRARKWGWLHTFSTLGLVMKLQLAATGAVALGLTVYLLNGGSPPLDPAPPIQAPALGDVEGAPELVAVASDVEREASAETAPVLPSEAALAPAAKFSINVQAFDIRGGPLAHADVWASPSSDTLNFIGRTDERG